MQAQNEEALAALVALLSGGRLYTAAQVAVACGCSKPTVYRRIRALSDRGYIFRNELVREGRKGPRSWAYAIYRGPA